LRLVLLGSDTFAAPLRALGHEVQTCGPTGDIAIADPDPSWDQVEANLKKTGFRPDAALVTDNVGNRQLPAGMAEAPIITAFYGVDSPLNRFWQEPYAQLFDLAFLDQLEEANRLAGLHPGAHWLPVGIEPSLYKTDPVGKEIPGVCFVGVVDENVRPKRSALLAKVEKISPLVVRGGRKDAWFPTSKAAHLYASHQITINENLFPGVTTRPLEVMASGGCLLSEAAPGSMDRFFRDQEHLCYFNPDNLEDILEQLLKDGILRARLRKQGREIVLAGHTLLNRVQDIVNKISGMIRDAQAGPRAQGGEALRLEGEAMLMAGLRWPAKSGQRRVLRGAMRLRAAAADGAKPLPASFGAGLAELSLGRLDDALVHLRRAGELGGARERLAWAMAAWQAGRKDEYGKQCQELGLESSPGEASFHLGAAMALAQAGQAASIGFNRARLHPAFWSGLEHLLESTSREPGQSRTWEVLGDLLLAQGAPNQASQAYDRAWQLVANDRVALKRTEAAHKGYML
jgi:tetratricopeptide (TPR) repeat protein